MCGIISVRMVSGKFSRNWVTLPDKTLRLFDTYEKAAVFADNMTAAAREEGIVGVGYRAKEAT